MDRDIQIFINTKLKGVTNILKTASLIVTILTLGVTIGYSSNDLPTTESAYSYLIKNNEVAFSVQSIEDENQFINTTFSTKNKTIFLETEKEISFIQVLNDKGELEYQLPIAASKLHIDMNDFTSGVYALNILLEGNDEYISTELEKNF